ncbi:hypothetical protein [Kineococcus sp. SYSU DK005]|uniref:hypothetical protein n=1 Tax=Kineococcus sp. SYSU DK005 TaxID=3383126 RepID=UPI003D7C9B31
MNDAAGRALLAATAVLQALSPLAAGLDQGSGQDPVVVPPGPFFAVWGFVVIGCLAVAVRGLAPARAASPLFRAVRAPLTAAQVGFALWLLAADRAPALTVPVFAGMLLALAVALRRAVTVDPGTGRADAALVRCTLGAYAGWSAAAVWVNTATQLQEPSRAVLAVLLAGAALTVSAGALLFRGSAGFTAAGAWALLGALVSTVAAGATGLAVLAGGGLVLAVVVAVLARRRRPSRPVPRPGPRLSPRRR